MIEHEIMEKTYDVFEATYPTLYVPKDGIRIAMLGDGGWQKECVSHLITSGFKDNITVYVDDLSKTESYDWLALIIKNCDLIVLNISDKDVSAYTAFMAGILLSMGNAIVTINNSNQKLDYLKAIALNVTGTLIPDCAPEDKVFEFLDAIEQL